MNATKFRSAVEHLPERYANRLPEHDRQDVEEFRDAGEWGELVDLLVASLRDTHAPVTTAERDELRQLMQDMNHPTDKLSTLRIAA